MAERSVVVRLRAEVGEFKRTMQEASKSTDALGKSTEAAGKSIDRAASAIEKSSTSATGSLSKLAASARDNEQAWSSVGTTFGAVGAAMAAGIGASIVKAAEFDAAMSKVRASTHESTENMDALREAAIAAGADTAFSATEAAGAVEELAKAGVSTADILGGGLNGALSLAAAGNIGVAEAAETAASAMTQFGLEGGKVPHIADLLAAGAGKAQGGVSDLGEALNQAGLVAAQTGLSIEETTGGLAAFASAGLLGSDAGTSFKTMLQALTPNSKAAADEMERIGFTAYDANGNFVGLEEVAGRLRTSLSDLSVEQQNAALKTIFGSDAVRAASVLYNEGAEGIAEWTANVNDAGYAAETAAINMDNLAGDIEGLKGSLETALIGTGQGADGPLRGLVQGLDGVVDAYNRMPSSAQGAVLATGGVTAAAALGAGAFFTFAPRVFQTIESFQELNKAGGPLSGRMRGIAGAVGTATGALVAFQAASAIAGTGVDDLGRAAQVVEAINDLDGNGAARLDELATAAGSGGAQVRGLADAVEQVNYGPLLKGLDKGASLFGVWDSSVGLSTDAISRYDAALALLAGNGAMDQAAQGADYLRGIVEAQGLDFAEFSDKYLPSYTDALGSLDLQQQVTAASATGMATTISGLYPSFESYVAGTQLSEEATGELRDRLLEMGESMTAFADPATTYSGLLAQATEAERAAAEATAAATTDQSDSWSDYVGSVSVSFDDYVAELEQNVADQQAWQTNMLLLAGRVSQGTLDELGRLGPEAAPLVADLVNQSDAELARLDDVFATQSEAATLAWGEKLEYAGPVLADIAARAGRGAAEAAAAELAAGTATIEDIASDYGVALANGVNPVLLAIGKRKVVVNQKGDGRLYNGPTKYAEGGYWDSSFGAEQPQFQHNHGDRGIKWAETGAGPWEAFISGHPAKRDRSIKLWRETGQRLGIPQQPQADYADGGFHTPGAVPQPRSTAPFREPLSTAAQGVMRRAYDEVRAWVESQAVVPGGGTFSAPGGSGTSVAALIAYGRALRAQGLRVSSNSALGSPPSPGAHSPTGYHYKYGNSGAIDVNSHAGESPAEKRRLTPVALDAMRRGFGVQWLSSGHYNHLHVDVGKYRAVGNTSAWLADGGVVEPTIAGLKAKGSVLNPHIRDSGGPLLPGFTLNATGSPETVIPRHAFPAAPTYARTSVADSGPLQLVGTLDLGNGLVGQMTAVATRVADQRITDDHRGRATRAAYDIQGV